MEGVSWLPLDHWKPNGASLLALTEVSAPRCREILHIWAVCIDPRRMCRASLSSNAQCRVKMPRPHTPECVFRIWKKANVLRPHLSSTALWPPPLPQRAWLTTLSLCCGGRRPPVGREAGILTDMVVVAAAAVVARLPWRPACGRVADACRRCPGWGAPGGCCGTRGGSLSFWDHEWATRPLGGGPRASASLSRRVAGAAVASRTTGVAAGEGNQRGSGLLCGRRGVLFWVSLCAALACFSLGLDLVRSRRLAFFPPLSPWRPARPSVATLAQLNNHKQNNKNPRSTDTARIPTFNRPHPFPRGRPRVRGPPLRSGGAS